MRYRRGLTRYARLAAGSLAVMVTVGGPTISSAFAQCRDRA